MTFRNTKPMVLFGTVEDLTTWTNGLGTPVVTGSISDPLGGTTAFSVNDDDGVTNIERLNSLAFNLSKLASGEAIVSFFVKKGTSTESHILLRDETAGVNRHDIKITWTGNLPVLATISGAGTLFTPVKVAADDWYFVRFSATGIVDANSHKIRLEPAGLNAAATGTILLYMRSAILFGLHLDNVRAWPSPRQGTQWVQSPSGVEDAWVTGDDEMLAGSVRWVSIEDVDNPQNRTGWDGRREEQYIGVGWAAFLKFAQDAQIIVFCPDQADVTINHNAYVKAPRDQDTRRHELESADQTRRFELILRDSDDKPFEGF